MGSEASNNGVITSAPSRLTGKEWLLLLLLAAVQFTHILDFMIVLPLVTWIRIIARFWAK